MWLLVSWNGLLADFAGRFLGGVSDIFESDRRIALAVVAATVEETVLRNSCADQTEADATDDEGFVGNFGKQLQILFDFHLGFLLKFFILAEVEHRDRFQSVQILNFGSGLLLIGFGLDEGACRARG